MNTLHSQQKQQQTKRPAQRKANPAAEKKPLTEGDLLAVCAMDSVNYLRRQKRNVELVRLRYSPKDMASASKQVVRVYATKRVTLVVVPPFVADILARKGMMTTSIYPKSEEGA